MIEVPYWCSESPLTGTYVASVCPHAGDTLQEPLDTAAEMFGRSTDAFLALTAEKPLRLDHLNFTTASAWQALSAQMVDRYRRAHWELVNSDGDYRTQLGEAYDGYERTMATRGKRQESPATVRRRHIQNVHCMVTEAAGEGIPTSIAAYAVLPQVVRLRRPHFDPEQQVAKSNELLPAVSQLSRDLARNSKQGNEKLLRALSGMGTHGRIDYKHLRYLPDLFDISPGSRGSDMLHTIGTYHAANDLQTPFRGCPAIKYGSVGKLNRFIARTIVDNECYERTLIPTSSRTTITI